MHPVMHPGSFYFSLTKYLLQVIRDSHALRHPPELAYTLRFVRLYLDAVAKHSTGEVHDELIEWYTGQLQVSLPYLVCAYITLPDTRHQAQPTPQHEGGSLAPPFYKTYMSRLGCVTMSMRSGWGGYETVGGTGSTLWEAAFHMYVPKGPLRNPGHSIGVHFLGAGCSA